MTRKKRPTEQAYAELQQAYDFYNDELFEGKLPPCLITFQREKRTMGYFSQNRWVSRKKQEGGEEEVGQRPRLAVESADEIALNPEYFAVIPLVEILQTICHEMTHCWQLHFGTPSRSCYHNTEWANKMESIGLMPSDTGEPGGKKTGQAMADYVIPGGKFYLATQRLLASGFIVSWFDRFPARLPTTYLPPASPAIMAGAWIENTAEPAEDDFPELSAIMTAAFTAPVALQPDLQQEMKEREQENRSNRSKYECSSCSQVSVWGRPGLKIKCVDCDKILEEAR